MNRWQQRGSCADNGRQPRLYQSDGPLRQVRALRERPPRRRGGRPGGSPCAAPDCDCPKFVEGSDARVPLGKDNLTPAEVAHLTGLSVHTLSYWRQTDQGPKTIKAGTRTLYRRKDVDQWLADIDGRSEPVRSSRSVGSESTSTTTGWYEKAVEAAGRIEPAHTSPWKLASTYALLSIAESLLTQHQKRQPGPVPSRSCRAADRRTSHRR
jgi:predicted DNA-binding transcriptional regulator AlpA